MTTVDLKSMLRERGLRLGELAEKLNVHKANASRWAKYCVPAERAIDIERETGIPRHDLRPDLWQRPDVGNAA
jgi:DNA-binding transcriptional regulator YdaS (Cro superfamily)